ncbi:MAG: APC family permease [Candidatus Dormibacteraceae bacterium]
MTDTPLPGALGPTEGAESAVAGAGTLRRNRLSMPEVLAQSVANAAPTAAMSLLPLLIFLSAGNGTWLSFVIAILLMLCVGWCASQFARRMSSAGSFYVWVARGLGPLAGYLAGWGLQLGYMATAVATLTGFAIFGNDFLSTFGVPANDKWVYAVLIAIDFVVPCAVAILDMGISARTSLILEGISICIILALCIAVWINKGSVISVPELTLKGVTPGGVLVGVVLSIFAFVGFESAGSLGLEAKNPYRAIGRAIMLSCVVVGIFYLIVSYTQVYGFQGTKPGFAAATAPMPQLAQMVGLGPLAPIIDLGIVCSMFACTLACVNAGGRMAFTMAHDGLGVPAMRRTHPTRHTPHVALISVAAIVFLFTVITDLAGVNMIDLTSWAGSVAAFGFMLAYVLVSVAAPIWLRRTGVSWVLVGCVGLAGAIVMAFVFWSSWLPQLIPGGLFPALTGVPEYLPYAFFAWALIGIVWYFIYRSRNPEQAKLIGARFESRE